MPVPRTLLSLAILTAVGCAVSDAGSASDQRIEEVRRARLGYAAPAAVLGSVTRDAERRVSEVRLGVPPTPDARLRAVAAARRTVLRRLRASIEDAERLAVDATGPEAWAAAAAWRRAVQASAQLAVVARADLDHVVLLARGDQQLADIVALWDAPGSYRTQLRRLAAARATAAQLSRRLRTSAPRPRCSRSLAWRVAAADAVAEASAQLRSLVAARRGEAFDARRAVLATDPFGLGPRRGGPEEALARLDSSEAACWRAEGATPAAAAGVLDALAGLQTALNPPDLSIAGSGRP